MGLFDNLLKNKLRKRKDEEIIKAENLMKEGRYYEAREILYKIYDDFPDDDIEYREDYIDELINKCGTGIEEHKKQAELTDKDSVAETVIEEKTDEFEVPERTDTLQDLQKQEALCRLDTLAKEGKMDGKPYIWFKNNILCGSFVDDDGNGCIKELDENYDLYQLAKSYEEELDCMVYHAVDAGHTAYLLTVHKDTEYWAAERPVGDKICVLIHSYDEDDYYYDDVRIFSNNGALGVEQAEEYSVYSKSTAEETAAEEDDEEEAEEREYILNVTAEQQQAEATARIKELAEKLGFKQTAVEWWEKRSKLTYSDMEKGFISSICTIRDSKERIKDFEDKKHAKVYHVIENSEGAYLLYVGGDKNCWGDEKLTLNDISVYSDVTTAGGYNISAYFLDAYTEVYNAFAEVELFCKDGTLSVKLIEKEKDPDIISGVYSDAELDKEIKKRLRVLSDRLGLDEMAYTNWCEGRLCCSRTDENGNVTIFPVEEDSEYARIAEQLEHSVNCMVYHIVDMGKNLYLLNILFSSGLKYGRLWKDSDTVSLLYCSKDNFDDTWYLDMDVRVTDGALVIIEEDEEDFEESDVKPAEETKATETLAETAEEDKEITVESIEETDNVQETDGKAETESEKTSAETAEPQEQLIDGYNAEQWFNMAMQYWNGDGVSKNLTKALEYMEKSAKLGSASAMHNCSIMYIEGQGTAANEEKAIYWMEKAAQHGDRKAMYNLAWQYFKGAGRDKDDVKGLDWLTKAAEAGNRNACFELGTFSEKGVNPVSQDAAKALYWYEKAAQLGDDDAMVKCFVAYVDGVGCEKDVDKGVYWLEEAVKRENAEAMSRMGMAQLHDAKTQDDIKHILATYLVPAANKGDADALYLCAEAFRGGSGFNKNEKKALELYTLAAEKGSKEAQKYLVKLYTEGGITAPDSEKALFWKEKLAENDAALAAEIANTYLNMEGKENKNKGFKWMHKAAQLGDLESMCILAGLYHKNNHKEGAFQYGLMAAEHGNTIEMHNTYMRYLDGIGCEKDVEKAAYWLEKAAENGFLASQYLWALWNANGKYTQPDYDKAFYWMQKALEKAETAEDEKKAEIYYAAALFYFNGHGTKADGEKAYEMFEKSALLGNKSAIEQLVHNGIKNIAGDKDTAFYWAVKAAENGDGGKLLRIGGSVYDRAFQDEDDGDMPQDIEEALRWWEKAAEFGDTFSMFTAGAHYIDDGSGKPYADNKKSLYWLTRAYDNIDEYDDDEKSIIFHLLAEHNRFSDDEKAYEFYQMAAELDDMDAINECCMMCLNGWVAESSNSSALRWAKKAAQLGNTGMVTAAAELFYEEDNDFPNDKAEALRWYEVAAEYGDEDAMLRVAKMYRYGDGCAVNLPKSHQWVEKLANKGHADVMCIVAADYRDGVGVEKDAEKEFEWFLKAAKAGDPGAMYSVGLNCMFGIGTEVSLEKAKEWFKKAEATDNKDVLEGIAKLKEKFNFFTW